MPPKKTDIFMLVALTVLVSAAGMLTGCKRNGKATNEAETQSRQMNPGDDLVPRLPALPEPDIVLEVKVDGYLVDGKPVRKLSLRDELAKAASQGKKVIEIRGSDSVSTARIKYVFEALDGAGFEQILMTSTDAATRKEGK